MSNAQQRSPHPATTAPRRLGHTGSLRHEEGHSYSGSVCSAEPTGDWQGLYRETLDTAPRLTPDDEQRLIAAMRAGGPGSTEARTVLWHAHLRWAVRIATWYLTPGARMDDLVQVAFVTLWNELPSVDATRGLVRNRVTGPIMRAVDEEAERARGALFRPPWLRRAERQFARLAETTLTDDDESGSARPLPSLPSLPQAAAVISFTATVGAQVAHPSAELAEAESRVARAEAVATLNVLVMERLKPREQGIIALRYGKLLPFAEIAERLGYASEHSCEVAHTRALAKLRQAAREQPEIAAALLEVLV